jgi:hypothetical protein
VEPLEEDRRSAGLGPAPKDQNSGQNFFSNCRSGCPSDCAQCVPLVLATVATEEVKVDRPRWGSDRSFPFFKFADVAGCQTPVRQGLCPPALAEMHSPDKPDHHPRDTRELLDALAGGRSVSALPVGTATPGCRWQEPEALKSPPPAGFSKLRPASLGASSLAQSNRKPLPR